MVVLQGENITVNCCFLASELVIIQGIIQIGVVGGQNDLGHISLQRHRPVKDG